MNALTIAERLCLALIRDVGGLLNPYPLPLDEVFDLSDKGEELYE